MALDSLVNFGVGVGSLTAAVLVFFPAAYIIGDNFYIKGLRKKLDLEREDINRGRALVIKDFSDDFKPDAPVNVLDTHDLPQAVVAAYSNILHAPNKQGREEDKQIMREYLTGGR